MGGIRLSRRHIPFPSPRNRFIVALSMLLLAAPWTVSAIQAAPRGAMPCTGLDDAPGCVHWTARVAGESDTYDRFTGLAQTPDGSLVFLAGTSERWYLTDPMQMRIVAFHQDAGTIAWSRAWSGPWGTSAEMRDIAVSPDGALVVAAGSSRTPVPTPGGWHPRAATLLALDATTGETRWENAWLGEDTTSKGFRAAAVSPDGRIVYAVGYTEPTGTTPGRLLAAAHDAASGDALWRILLPSSTPSRGTFLDVAPHEGGAVVAGQGFLASLDRETGSAQWWVEMPVEDRVLMQHVLIHADRAYVAAETDGPTTPPVLTVAAYDLATGSLAWTATRETLWAFGAPGHRPQLALDAARDRLYVAGMMRDKDLGSRAMVAAFNLTTGALAWDVRPVGNDGGATRGASVALAPDGGTVYLVSSTRDAVPYNYYVGDPRGLLVAALDAGTGAEQWRAKVDVPDDATAAWEFPCGGLVPCVPHQVLTADEGRAALVSPDGARLFAAGEGTEMDKWGSAGSDLVLAAVGLVRASLELPSLP